MQTGVGVSSDRQPRIAIQVETRNRYGSKLARVAIVRGYGRIKKILTDFSLAQVLPFDDAAAVVFDA